MRKSLEQLASCHLIWNASCHNVAIFSVSEVYSADCILSVNLDYCTHSYPIAPLGLQWLRVVLVVSRFQELRDDGVTQGQRQAGTICGSVQRFVAVDPVHGAQ